MIALDLHVLMRVIFLIRQISPRVFVNRVVQNILHNTNKINWRIKFELMETVIFSCSRHYVWNSSFFKGFPLQSKEAEKMGPIRFFFKRHKNYFFWSNHDLNKTARDPFHTSLWPLTRQNVRCSAYRREGSVYVCVKNVSRDPW